MATGAAPSPALAAGQGQGRELPRGERATGSETSRRETAGRPVRTPARTLRAQSFHVAEPRAGFADKKALLKQWKYTGFVLASISDKSKPRRSHGYAPGPGGPHTRRDVTPLNAPGDHRAPGPPRPGTAPPGRADVRTAGRAIT